MSAERTRERKKGSDEMVAVVVVGVMEGDAIVDCSLIDREKMNWHDRTDRRGTDDAALNSSHGSTSLTESFTIVCGAFGRC